MVAGGTLLQLFVPFALAVYFVLRQKQIPGTAFCGFFFFEQLLPVGTYMADARSQSLTYVTAGDPDLAEHDWFYLFSHAGVLDHDTQIGGAVRILGFIGMFAVVAWLIWRAWKMQKLVHPTGMPSSKGCLRRHRYPCSAIWGATSKPPGSRGSGNGFTWSRRAGRMA